MFTRHEIDEVIVWASTMVQLTSWGETTFPNNIVHFAVGASAIEFWFDFWRPRMYMLEKLFGQ